MNRSEISTLLLDRKILSRYSLILQISKLRCFIVDVFLQNHNFFHPNFVDSHRRIFTAHFLSKNSAATDNNTEKIRNFLRNVMNFGDKKNREIEGGATVQRRKITFHFQVNVVV